MTQDESIDMRVTRIEQHFGIVQNDLSTLKQYVAELRVDVGVLKLAAATKGDLARAKSTIISWVVGAVFLAQLLPTLLKALVG